MILQYVKVNHNAMLLIYTKNINGGKGNTVFFDVRYLWALITE